MTLLLEHALPGSTSLDVECLRCGEERRAAQSHTAARGIAPAECPGCGYLGWRQVDDSRHAYAHSWH